MRMLFVIGAVACGNESRLRSTIDPLLLPSDDPAVTCEDAVSDVRTLLFTAREGCAFSRDGNLDPRNEFLQARADEARFVDLPEGAQLCELSLASGGEQVAFDDHLALLVEDVVLVSGGSGGALDDHQIVDGLPRFDWEAIRGRPFADRYTAYECLGGGTCVVPRTEEVGPLDVRVDPDTMASLVEALDPVDGFDVRIVTFGDDDANDCAHSHLELELTVRYVP